MLSVRGMAFGFGVSGSGFWVLGLGLRLGFRVRGFRVLGLRVLGSEFLRLMHTICALLLPCLLHVNLMSVSQQSVLGRVRGLRV